MNNNYRQLRNRKVEIVYEGRTQSSDLYSEDEENSNPSLPRTSSPLNSETQEGNLENNNPDHSFAYQDQDSLEHDRLLYLEQL